MQEDRPMVYASKTLNEMEQRYAAIELLGIVYECNTFYFYIYGKQHVTIHLDHKPIETL